MVNGQSIASAHRRARERACRRIAECTSDPEAPAARDGRLGVDPPANGEINEELAQYIIEREQTSLRYMFAIADPFSSRLKFVRTRMITFVYLERNS